MRSSRLIRRCCYALGLGLGLLALVPPAYAQGRTDVIRGRVSDDSDHAIPRAQIAVTRAPDRQSLFAQTDTAGNYELSFPNGTGDYLVHVAAPGMNEFRKRITRVGAETTFVVDAKLQSTVATLEAVRVKARAVARLERGDALGAELGETPALGSFQASLTPSQAGDLDAAAATQPGIRALTGGGISAHGLSADQNSATLNGMAFDASFLPRDAGAEIRVGASPYDVSAGGYSGTEVAARIDPGTWLARKTAHITLDAPPMQFGLRTPAGMAPRFTSIDAGVGRSGEIVERVSTYRVAAQGAYSTTPITAFGDAAAGLSSDDRATVNASLAQIGIPTRATSGLDRVRRGRGSVVLQLDRTQSQRVSLSELFYAGVNGD